ILKGSRENDVSTGQLAYNLNLYKFNLSIGPYLMRQKLNTSYAVMDQTDAGIWQSSAARISAVMGYNAAGNNFSVQADYGYIYEDNTGKMPPTYTSMKFVGSWT